MFLLVEGKLGLSSLGGGQLPALAESQMGGRGPACSCPVPALTAKRAAAGQPRYSLDTTEDLRCCPRQGGRASDEPN